MHSLVRNPKINLCSPGPFLKRGVLVAREMAHWLSALILAEDWRFESKHSHGGLQLLLTPFPGAQTPTGFLGYQACMWCGHKQANHLYT